MSTIEITLGVSTACLAIALTITSVRLARHDRYFEGIDKIITVIGLKIMSLEKDIKANAVKEKENV